LVDDKQGLTTWELVMLALGTVVGGSFFLGSAIAMRAAGPAIILSFLIGGLLVYFILTALSEMTVADPATGSFRTFAERNFGPWLGFVVGWVYWTGLTLAMSSEATAASIFLRNLWLPGVPLGVIATIIVVAVTLLNLTGARLFSRLETSLAAVKLLALVGFTLLALFLIAGIFPGRQPVGLGALRGENLFPGGLAGIAGSMLIVIFTYAGFEVVGLAAPESRNPRETIPRAIMYTVISLVALYLAVLSVLLPLIPTGDLTTEVSPLVMALSARNLGFTAGFFNFVMLTAILSTMLAATFGLGRILHSLALEGHAPSWLKKRAGEEVPKRGILFSGAAMLAGVSLSYILPRQVYLFLISSGGFSLLFAYIIIMFTHYRFRSIHGCPPRGQCQLPGYPYTSWITLVSLLAIAASMPLIPGQGTGLWAGLILTGFFVLFYPVSRLLAGRGEKAKGHTPDLTAFQHRVSTEAADELTKKKGSKKGGGGKNK